MTTEPPPGDVAVPTEEPAPSQAPRATAEPRGSGWREELLGAEVALLAVAVWLVVSPLVLGYDSGDDAWAPIAGGIVIGVCSILRITGAWRMRALGLLSVLAGAALLVGAPLLEGPIEGRWNQGLAGGVVIVLALIGLAGTERGRELHPDDG